ncbi:MAG: pilus assembly protein PilO [Candidatus Electrothrix sp. AX5]|jgi:type IV pilus assembly protein PilO|uniref:Type IV pilus assembly protein PilO n=1 Tax=Candidatus Electrothrix aarhusensis TaxID=1859131 RepID=A0A3S3U8C1_9BACT|nr:pilus assembly protein PilO [Candidatus Electrothrix sp. AX5]RWX46032.1 type IV pilus assembly protein PilO [Candidatus Electrothrix aarhusensis]
MASENTASKFDVFIEEKYIPLDQKIKIAVAVGVVAALLAGFYFVVLTPKLEKIDALESKQAALQADVDKAKKAAKNLKQHEEELKAANQKFEEISIVLPKTKEIPALLTSISDHGTSAGLDFNSFVPGNETPKEFYAEIPISIKVSGPYHNVGYFLDQVSKLERIVTVKDITMGSPKQVEGEMLLTSSCNLLTYRFTNEEAAGAPKKGKKGK